MASRNEVNIQLTAQNRATGAINQVQSSLRGLESTAGVAAKGMAALAGAFTAGALLNVASSVGGAVVEMARLAEQSAIVGTSFEQLAARAGASANNILAALKRASGGTISEYNLMLASNKALMLGVADSAEEMQALMLVAGERGRALGLTMEQAFDNLVTGIGRGSALILDNLGISLGDIQKANEDLAASLGTTVGKLDDAQKKTALMNVVMQEAAGIDMSNVEAMTSDFERAQAAIADMKVVMGEFVAGPLGDAVREATNLLTILSKGPEALAAETRSSALDQQLAGIPTESARQFEKMLADARAAEQYLPGLTKQVEDLASTFVMTGQTVSSALDQIMIPLEQAGEFALLDELERRIDALPVQIDALKGPLAGIREQIMIAIDPTAAQAEWFGQVGELLSFVQGELAKVSAGAASSNSFYVSTITALRDAAALAGPEVELLAYEALQLDAAVQTGVLSAAEAQSQYMDMIPAIMGLRQETAALAESMALTERMARANATSILQSSGAAAAFANSLSMVMGNAFGVAAGLANYEALARGAAEATAELDRAARVGATSIVQSDAAADQFGRTLVSLMGAAFGTSGSMADLNAVTSVMTTEMANAERMARAGATSIVQAGGAASTAAQFFNLLGGGAMNAAGGLWQAANAANATIGPLYAAAEAALAMKNALIDARAESLKSSFLAASGTLGAGQAQKLWQSSESALRNMGDAMIAAGVDSETMEFRLSSAANKMRDNVGSLARGVDKATSSAANFAAGLTGRGGAVGAVGGGGGGAGSGGVVGALNETEQAAQQLYDTLNGKVAGVLQGSLDPGVGVNPDDFLPRPDAINENARRLADIMVNGFKGQDWLGEFQAEAPNVYEALLTAGDPKAAAAQMLRDFQAGLVPELIDKDAVKEAVKRSIMGENTMAQLAQEITGELVAEMGGDPGATADLVNQAMGRKVSGSGDMTQQVVGALQATSFMSSVEGAASNAADKWASGFLARIQSNVPGNLISILADLVTPYVQRNQQAQATLTGAQ